jgi:hypothetical protein
MGQIKPIAVQAKTAAKMLDMSQAEFKSLVECGALPGPQVHLIDGQSNRIERWRVADLEAILSGDAIADDEFKW